MAEIDLFSYMNEIKSYEIGDVLTIEEAGELQEWYSVRLYSCTSCDGTGMNGLLKEECYDFEECVDCNGHGYVVVVHGTAEGH